MTAPRWSRCKACLALVEWFATGPVHGHPVCRPWIEVHGVGVRPLVPGEQEPPWSNPWMMDVRAAEAEVHAHEAETLRRWGQHRWARDLWRLAGEGFAAVAVEVPDDYPNTRRDLTDAAIVCFTKAGAPSASRAFLCAALKHDGYTAGAALAPP